MWVLDSYAPFRISFAGGGTDVSPYVEKNGGVVVNSTIDRGVITRYSPDGLPLEVSSRDLLESHTFGMKVSDQSGVMERLLTLMQGHGVTDGKLSISSDVPPGSGLGSSSALTISILQILDAIRNVEEKGNEDTAARALGIERDFFHIALGKQDPYAIANAGFKKVEFLPGGEVRYTFLKNDSFRNELEKRCLLVYTGMTRESSKLLRRQMELSERGEGKVIDSLNAIRKTAESIFRSAENGDIDDFCDLINQGWKLKRNLGEGVTNERVESIISTAMNNGAQAARLLGGGSQGFILLVSRESGINELQRKMMEASKFVIRTSFQDAGRAVHRKGSS
ncbi:MAG: kinase [Candidatus Thermoplasmatota archaeon]|nr:kinase [Candidatus Thermoplasmatota archaeon]